MRSRAPGPGRRSRWQDRGSRIWISLATIAGVLAAVLLATRHVASLPTPVVWLVAGLIVAWVGMLLRAWAVVTLGRSYTTNVAARSDQRVVTSGPYRLVRHPAYLGLLILLLGFGLSLGDLASAVVLVVLPTIAIVRRIVVEEAALQAGLGDSYIEYCGSHSRLIPGVR